MGTWGYGVFDGDSPQDYLGKVVRKLVGDIEADLKSMENPQDHLLSRDMIAAIAILNAIARGIKEVRYYVAKETVRSWRTRFFEWFERNFVPANGPSVEYRANIEKEFRNLIAKLEYETLDA